MLGPAGEIVHSRFSVLMWQFYSRMERCSFAIPTRIMSVVRSSIDGFPDEERI